MRECVEHGSSFDRCRKPACPALQLYGKLAVELRFPGKVLNVCLGFFLILQLNERGEVNRVKGC